MKPTIRQIAKKLGLSPATVSKAISGKHGVNGQTRSRVLACMQDMGYIPLRGNEKHPVIRIAVLIKDDPRRYEETTGFDDAFSIEHNIFHYDIIMGLREYAEKKNMELIMLTAADETQKALLYDNYMRSKNIGGAFIYGLRIGDPYFLQLQSTSIPTVILDASVDNPLVGRVGIDNVAGAILAVEHLIALGHSRIGFLNGHPQAHAARERFSGYAAALCRHSIPFRRELVQEGDSTVGNGREWADYFAAKGITALFCASDYLALGAIERFHQKGIKVPTDISVIGFDNLPVTNLYTPRITTIAQDRRQIGLTAGALLSGILAGEPILHCVLTPVLVEKESTAPPSGM